MSTCQATRRSVHRSLRRFRLAALLLSCAAGIFLATSGPASAAIFKFTPVGASTDWNDPNNWTNLATNTTGVLPGAGDVADVGGGFIATISGTLTNPSIGGVYVGPDAQNGNPDTLAGTLNHTAGTINVGDTAGPAPWFRVGQGPGGTGTYNMSGTAVLNAPNDVIRVGEAGTGVMTMTDTSILNTRGINLGDNGNGSLTIGGSAQLNDTGTDIVVGNSGTGTFTQNDATSVVNETAGWTYIGNNAGSHGTYTLNNGSFTNTGGWLVVGHAGNGTFNQNGGNVTLTDTLWVGVDGPAVGNYNLSAGTLNVTNDIRIGQNGGATGTLRISGGTLIHTKGDVHLGEGGGNGTITQTGGDASYETGAGNWVNVGQNGGTGTYNLSGGTARITYNGGNQPWLLVGRDSSHGTFNISGTGDLESATMWVGQSSSTGIVNQTGGTVNLGTLAQNSDTTFSTGQGEFRIGFDSGHGTYNMSGGTLNSSQNMQIGNDSGVGVVNQTGGMINLGNGNAGTGWLLVGNGGGATESGTFNMSAGTLVSGRVVVSSATGSHGTFNQTGGLVTSTNDASVGDGVNSTGTYNISGPSSGPGAVVFSTGIAGNENGNANMGLLMGWGGLGTFNQNGGLVQVGQEGIGFNSDNNDPTGRGVYNLSAGVLQTGAVFKIGVAGTATFNFNGGTLQVSKFTGNRPFFMGPGNPNLGDGNPLPALTAANVQAGGAIIDLNSFGITISQNLLHDPGLAVGTPDGGLTLSDSSLAGGGSLTLTGSNTFNGTTNVLANATAGPTLFVGNTGALQNSTVNISFSNSVQFTTGLGSATFGGLSGTGNLSLNDVGAAPVALTVGGNGSTTSYSGVMSGGGSLTKQGAGALTLSTSQTFTGPTVVNAGKLILPSGVSLASGTLRVGGATATPGTSPTISGSGTVTGSVTINGVSGGEAGHIAPGANTAGTNFGGAGTLNVGPLTLNGGSILDFDFGALGPGNSDLIASTGALTLPAAGTGSVTVNLNNLGGFAIGTYKLITETSTTNFTTTVFSTGTDISGFQYAFTNPGGTEIDMVVTAAPTWSSTAVDSNWANSANWVSGIIPGSTSGTSNTDTATFDRNSTVLTPAPDAGRNLQSIKFNSFAGAYVIGTTGGNALLLTTGGKIQMTSSVANTERVNAPLILEGASATYTFSNDATDNTKLLIIGGSVSGGTAGNTVLTLAGANTGTTTGVNAVNGVISNGSATTLGIAKTGGGIWLLGGNNTFTGGVDIEAGVLAVGNPGALNSAAPNAVSFGGASTGVLALNGINVTISGLNSTSPTAVVVDGSPLGGNATLTVNSASPSSFAGALADGPGGGKLSLVVSGGSLTLSGNSTASGTTDVTGTATLTLASLNALQDSTLNMTVANSVQFTPGVGTFNLGGLTGSAGLTLQDTSAGPVTVAVGNNNSSTTYSGVLSGSGGLTKVGTGTFTVINANTYTGTTRVSAGTLQLGNGTTSNGSVASGAIVDNAVLAFANPNPQTYAGSISGTGSVTKTAAGTLTLTGNSSYSGGTNISGGGTVAIGPANFAASPLGTGTVTLAGATLALKGSLVSGLTANLYNNAPANVGNSSPDYASLSAMNSHFTGLGAPAVSVLTSTAGKANLDYSNNNGGRAPMFGGTGATQANYGFPSLDNFEANFNGLINIQAEGDYTFSTTSDDGSVVFLDGVDTPVVNNNFYQGMTTRSGIVHLTAGQHAIALGFYEGGGGLGWTTQYSGPDTAGSLIAIPNAVLVPDTNPLAINTIQSYPNGLAVTATSTVNITGSLAASMGPLSLGAVTLNVTSASATTDPYSLTFNGNSTLTGNGTLNVANSTGGGPGQVNVSGLGGAFSLTKTGPGVLSMSGPGTYSGGTIIAASSGLVIANNPGSLGTGPVTLNNATTLRVVAGTPTVTGATLSGFNGGTNWTVNGGSVPTAAFSGNTLTLTDGANGESRSVFFNTPQSVSSNLAIGFTYTATGGGTLADGTAVIFQNDPRGATALGGGGGGLGYSGITPSAAYQINVYPPNTVGTGVNVNGATGGYTTTGTVNEGSGDPINVVLVYDATGLTLTEVLTDTVNGNTFTQVRALPADLATLAGGPTAFFGFSGATGGANSTQILTNFSLGSGVASIYSNNVVLTGGSSSTIDVGATAIVPSVTMGGLTVGSGVGTTLNLTATTAPAGTAYGLSLGPATVNGNVAINIANNGTARGTLTLTGASNLAAGVTINQNSGTLQFNNTSGPATVAAGVTINVASAASMILAGTVSDLSGNGANPVTPANRAHIVNSSTQAGGGGLVVTGTNQQVGAIDGAGDTVVNAGASLTANHIVQSALVIGGTATSPATVIIAASDPSGNPLAGGSALAGSSEPMNLGGSNLLAGGSARSGALLGGSVSGAGLGGGVASVPEPSSILLVVLGSLACLVPVIRRKARKA